MAEGKRQVSVARIAEALGASYDGPESMVRGISQPNAPEKDTVIVVSDEGALNDALGAAGLLVVSEELAGRARQIGVPVVVAPHVRHALRIIIDELFPMEPPVPGVHEKAVVAGSAAVDPSARIDAGAVIGERAVIGPRTRVMANAYVGDDTVIGAETVLHPNVTVYHNVSIGDRVTIHANSVVGSDGFGYVEQGGKHLKMQQIGTVRIEDEVEIGSNTSIDRAAIGVTVIGEGTKIDNLCQIAHNVVTGKGCIIISGSGIAGSATLGDYVIVAGQAGVKDHISLASGTIVAARSGIIKDTDKPGVYVGFPAVPQREFAKTTGLPKQVDRLKKKISELESKIK